MRYLAGAVALALLAIAPNLIWLGASTVRIQNASNQAISRVAYSACDTTHSIETLFPGESTFQLLEACGDDSLEILIDNFRFFQIYVEGELYHVDATIATVDAIQCEYADPFSSLFLAKILW